MTQIINGKIINAEADMFTGGKTPAASAGYGLVFTTVVKNGYHGRPGSETDYGFVEINRELPVSLIGKRVKIEITELP